MILKVLEKRQDSEGISSLILEKPKNYFFYAGQYIDIELPVKDTLGNTRTLSFSSSPTEDYLSVTFKKGVTPYKKCLEGLSPGNTFKTTHPIGTFTLDESSEAIFIAGGVGIAPFRSIIKYVLDQKLKTKMTLIYSNSNEDFPFKKELDLWQKVLPNLKIIYHNTAKLPRLTTLDTKYLIPNSIFYLAGPPGMVYGLQKKLLDLEIDNANIRIESFDGY